MNKFKVGNAIRQLNIEKKQHFHSLKDGVKLYGRGVPNKIMESKNSELTFVHALIL